MAASLFMNNCKGVIGNRWIIPVLLRPQQQRYLQLRQICNKVQPIVRMHTISLRHFINRCVNVAKEKYVPRLAWLKWRSRIVTVMNKVTAFMPSGRNMVTLKDGTVHEIRLDGGFAGSFAGVIMMSVVIGGVVILFISPFLVWYGIYHAIKGTTFKEWNAMMDDEQPKNNRLKRTKIAAAPETSSILDMFGKRNSSNRIGAAVIIATAVACGYVYVIDKLLQP
jgi:hypothetical protein